VRRLYVLKGRDATQPSALVCSNLATLFALLPELGGRPAAEARVLLPGPYTLILPNPARRFPWLTGARPETIGVRVPVLPPSARAVVEAVGAVVATSANVPGEPEPAHVEDVPEAFHRGCGAIVDGGTLPGTPSTILDLTGPTPRVIREGVVPAADALALLAHAAARGPARTGE
jgi:L-threonylcarbamoyladenylate synthase